MAIVTVEKSGIPSDEQASGFCRRLEEGSVLYFPETPFEIPAEDRRFLLGVHQSDRSYHKNIAYRPRKGKITGAAKLAEPERARLKGVMESYSRQVEEFAAALLAPYRRRWSLDYATFRSVEEEGRDIRITKRNDRLHVDAFPTRPTCGDRILRVFTNIHPSRPRRWLTKQSFPELVKLFGGRGIPLPKPSGGSLWPITGLAARRLARAMGLPVAVRSPYDVFMLRFHHFLKRNQEFHDSEPRNVFDFPPNSSWMVYADGVAHAVLTGQYALEQTFLVSREAMVEPGICPAAVLERICGGPLTALG